MTALRRAISSIGVFTPPGATTLQRICSAAYWLAMTRLNPRMPCFDDTYAAPPMARTEATDPMFTIAPPPAARKWGIAYLHIRKAPRRFTATTRSNTASSRSSSFWSSSTVMPAMLARADSDPNRETAAAMSDCTLAES